MIILQFQKVCHVVQFFGYAMNNTDRPITVDRMLFYQKEEKNNLRYSARLEKTGYGKYEGVDLFVWTIILER